MASSSDDETSTVSTISSQVEDSDYSELATSEVDSSSDMSGTDLSEVDSSDDDGSDNNTHASGVFPVTEGSETLIVCVSNIVDKGVFMDFNGILYVSTCPNSLTID